MDLLLVPFKTCQFRVTLALQHLQTFPRICYSARDREGRSPDYPLSDTRGILDNSTRSSIHPPLRGLEFGPLSAPDLLGEKTYEGDVG